MKATKSNDHIVNSNPHFSLHGKIVSRSDGIIRLHADYRTTSLKDHGRQGPVYRFGYQYRHRRENRANGPQWTGQIDASAHHRRHRS